MKFKGEVSQQRGVAVEVEIELCNVRRVGCADYCGYGSAKMLVPFGSAKSFPVGRIVEITIKPKRETK